MYTHILQKLSFIFLSLSLSCIVADAQFNSGSTGADGALDLTPMTCPHGACFVQLPESGVLNYTTVNIPAGKSLVFLKNSRNTSVTLLAQGDVVLTGGVSVSSVIPICGNAPLLLEGPGGFKGGQPGRPGFGPGGGQTNGNNGTWIGPLSGVPIMGGSGGAGTVLQFWSGYGGPGGGAITIASSTSITGGGPLEAKGARNGNCSYSGSSGSGGAIRLVATTINYGGTINACGLSTGSCGLVRLEATSLTFTGSSNPAAVLSPINPVVVSSELPVLSITAVAGYAVPSYAGRRTDTVDILLPNQIADPVAVSVTGNNIPTGTEVRIGFFSGSPNGVSTPCNLAGTFANSSCNATLSNLARTSVTYLLATAAFDPPAALAAFNPKGENHVARVKLESKLGGNAKYVFLDTKGREIEANKLAKEFLAFFGI